MTTPATIQNQTDVVLVGARNMSATLHFVADQTIRAAAGQSVST
jgi:hypothetical protein